MNPTNFSAPKLHDCLQEEVIAMTSLARLLKIEETALVNGDVDKLNGLTQEKSQLLARLSKLEDERKSHLGQHGFSPDVKGMQDYLSKIPTEDSSAKHWDTLLDISEKAKENNRTNGMLISRQINRNQSALNILQQKGPAGSMYGPNGQATNNPQSGRGFVAG